MDCVLIPGGLARFDLAVTRGAVQPFGMRKMGERDLSLTGIEGDDFGNCSAIGHGFARR